MTQNKFAVLSCIAALALLLPKSLACGPFFPNSLLSTTDSVRVAPSAQFEAEIRRLKVIPSALHANLATNSYSEQTAEADIADLRAALQELKTPPAQLETIVTNYQNSRRILQTYAAGLELENSRRLRWGEEQTNATPLGTVLTPPGLPEEFVHYLHGSISWYNQHTNAACAEWEAVLKLPSARRQFKSTWAAYMLGKACMQTNPESALKYFAQVRTLAGQHFRDSLGLAFASQGWEAKIHLTQKHFETAAELYLQQSSRDASAIHSLCTLAARVFADEDADLRSLALNPKTRAILTAYLISRHWPKWDDDHYAPPDESSEDPQDKPDSPPPQLRWLEAIEAAGVSDLDSAERLALLAYQSGEMETAQRWINRAPQTPTVQWLQAKLFLRDGQLDRAAQLLAKIAPSFPLQPLDTNAPRTALDTHLAVEMNRPVGQQVLGELGVLHLARNEFTQALDALLRSGFWTDSAFIAERVLTLDELKSYVDGQWPEAASDPENATAAQKAEAETRGKIRCLLGRRLTRSSRGSEANSYFPPELRTLHASFITALIRAWDESQPKNQRAEAFFEAAKTARFQGIRILGTELEPDWAIWDGEYDTGGPDVTTRANMTNALSLVSANEMARWQLNHIDPEERFHYRYIAGDLAWAAAQFMPDNSDETARVLCMAGTWIKYRNPKEADRFYKALVRRCRKTEMGRLADKRRWFPEIDADGHLLPPPAPKQEQEPESTEEDVTAE